MEFVGIIDEGEVSLTSSDLGTPFVVGVGLLSDPRICGRHFARCFAAGALASSSGGRSQQILSPTKKQDGSGELQFRHRSSRASIAIVRAGGFIMIRYLPIVRLVAVSHEQPEISYNKVFTANWTLSGSFARLFTRSSTISLTSGISDRNLINSLSLASR